MTSILTYRIRHQHNKKYPESAEQIQDISKEKNFNITSRPIFYWVFRSFQIPILRPD